MSESANGHEEETKVSDRYELSDLFGEESKDTQEFLKMVGVVLLVILMALALSIPLSVLGD